MKGRNSEDFSSLKIGVVQIHSFFRNKFPIIECSVLSFIFFTKKELIKSLCSQGSLSQDFIFLMAFKEKNHNPSHQGPDNPFRKSQLYTKQF